MHFGTNSLSWKRCDTVSTSPGDAVIPIDDVKPTRRDLCQKQGPRKVRIAYGMFIQVTGGKTQSAHWYILNRKIILVGVEMAREFCHVKNENPVREQLITFVYLAWPETLADS